MDTSLTITAINELCNDVAVSRLVMNQYQEDIEKLPGYGELQAKIAEEGRKKSEAQEKLIEAMKASNLRSWKTDKANFSRAFRWSVSIDPVFKKDIEIRLKAGEEIEGYELKQTEFLSIRAVKNG